LVTALQSNVSADPRISAPVQRQVGIALEGEVSFVTSERVRESAVEAGLDASTTEALVEGYEDSQLIALRTGLLLAALLSLVSLAFTRHLPASRLGGSAPVATRGSPAGGPAP
jgi:hypothetical protein